MYKPEKPVYLEEIQICHKSRSWTYPLLQWVSSLVLCHSCSNPLLALTHPWKTLICFLSLKIILHFLEFNRNENLNSIVIYRNTIDIEKYYRYRDTIEMKIYSIWPLSLNIIMLAFIQVEACINCSSLIVTE